MKIDVLTIFPEFFGQVFDFGIIRRAKLAGIVEINVHDIREFAADKHRMVDDRPFGGGEGMVLKPEPIFAAVESLLGTSDKTGYEAGTRVVLLTPQGRPLKQATVKGIADDASRLVIICGRYEGVDERVSEALVTDEISIGDYVLSGGEPAALVMADSVVRLLPGALGSESSALNESFTSGILDYPHYTRPAEFRGMKVPDVLLNGNHREIENWRRERALEKPDLTDEIYWKEILVKCESPDGAGLTAGRTITMNRLDVVENTQLRENIPNFQPGDTLRVHVRIKEGNKERLQAFEGICIARKHGGARETVTVRKVSFGVGVERIFPLHGTVIDHIDVVRRGRVRRAKLYYLRELRGKAARIKEKDTRAKGKQAASE